MTWSHLESNNLFYWAPHLSPVVKCVRDGIAFLWPEDNVHAVKLHIATMWLKWCSDATSVGHCFICTWENLNIKAPCEMRAPGWEGCLKKKKDFPRFMYIVDFKFLSDYEKKIKIKDVLLYSDCQ